MIESYTWTGRLSKPLIKKLNPVWWFGNDFEPNAPQWYLDQGGSQFKWYLRNFVQNCESFCGFWPMLMISAVTAALIFGFGLSRWWFCILIPLAFIFTGGFEDKNYTVRGTAPILTTDPGDTNPPTTGAMWKLSLLYGFVPLPYFAYDTGKSIFHLGWNPNGKFVKKFTQRNSSLPSPL